MAELQYSEAVEMALAELGARQRRQQTIAAYRADLRIYGRFCSQTLRTARTDLTLEQCAALGVSAYLRHLRADRRNAPATVARRLAAVRALRPLGVRFKVGLQLFAAAGPADAGCCEAAGAE
jgi:site-specific recombinase XerD